MLVNYTACREKNLAIKTAHVLANKIYFLLQISFIPSLTTTFEIVFLSPSLHFQFLLARDIYIWSWIFLKLFRRPVRHKLQLYKVDEMKKARKN